MINKLLKMAIIATYESEGIKSCFDSALNTKEDSRKKAKEIYGSNYNETEFECGHIAAKLEIATILVNSKEVAKKYEDRLQLANYLVDIARELKDIQNTKEEKKEEKVEYKVGDIVEYIGDNWKEGITNPCKITEKFEITKTFGCMDKNGLIWFLKENEFKKWEK